MVKARKGLDSRLTLAWVTILVAGAASPLSAQLTRAGEPAQLDIREAGEHAIRVTFKPIDFAPDFPQSPTLDADYVYGPPVLSLRSLDTPTEARVGSLTVLVRPEPLSLEVRNARGESVQTLVFAEDGTVSFTLGDGPVLGMGEGGPEPGRNWRSEHEVEFDRRGRFFEMLPRWQRNAYGSRNPVALLVGTDGWGLYVATPWVQVDLREEDHGTFIPWERPDAPAGADEDAWDAYTAKVQGRPPASQPTEVFDAFVFDASDPAAFMKDVSLISGAAVMAPKWTFGYMQSHRELTDDELSSEELLIDVVDTFREKEIPVDALIYLGTGFTRTGWNTRQPSFDFNPAVFDGEPAEVLADLEERNVKIAVHMVPWDRDRLPTLHGTIPPAADESLDEGHIWNYWQEHLPVLDAGVDAFWPDEGDWLDLFERIKRHQMYYQGPIATNPNVRPWSLHRNGHLGIAQWGGWVWSGDTDSSWKTLEAQIAVGINHSLSIGPYWGTDTGGFFTTSELSGELYARWFQFSAFTPSFRSHGKIWRLRLPWGWGLDDMGDHEGERDPPLESEMGNPAIEPVAKKYAELRYRLIPYTYTLAREVYDSGMPFIRALWLHYPDDERALAVGTEYLWGRDLLIAPVFEKGVGGREVYLPDGDAWYDWWSNERHEGGQTVARAVDLETMPIFARAGAIIPFDPVRQHMEQQVDGPTTIKVFTGADGEFTLYEDDGISLEYLEGQGTWTRMAWDEETNTLTIGPGGSAGTPNVAPEPRSFEVQLLPRGETQTVQYDGEPVQVVF
jgi:alpha-glucosidase (family GH31 glycosyl hydrolase)